MCVASVRMWPSAPHGEPADASRSGPTGQSAWHLPTGPVGAANRTAWRPWLATKRCAPRGPSHRTGPPSGALRSVPCLAPCSAPLRQLGPAVKDSLCKLLDSASKPCVQHTCRFDNHCVKCTSGVLGDRSSDHSDSHIRLRLRSSCESIQYAYCGGASITHTHTD